MLLEIQEIDDDDELYRRLHSSAVAHGRITPGAFKTGDVYDTKISVNLARQSSVEDTLKSRPHHGIGVFAARVPRRAGFTVQHKPELDPLNYNPAHCEIEGENNRIKSRRLAEAMKILVYPKTLALQ